MHRSAGWFALSLAVLVASFGCASGVQTPVTPSPLSVAMQDPKSPPQDPQAAEPEEQAEAPAEGEQGRRRRRRADPQQVEGYPEGKRKVGGPTDVDRDLATSFPKPNSVLPGKLPAWWFDWKEDLYKTHGVRAGISYHALFQRLSTGTDNQFPLPGTSDRTAAAGWLLVEGKWEAINRGEDWQGSLTAAFEYRHEIGDKEPAFFQTNTGSLWPTDFAFLDLDPWFPILFWEQWVKKDRFVFRLGSQSVGQIYDFFRFKDARVAFSGSQNTVPAASMPLPPPGALSASFELWPVEESPLYVVGTVNDLNAEPGEWSWDNAVDDWQFFYGLEVGYNWVRGPKDFDHAHINFFWADEADTQPFVFPNDAGWGMKIAGEKQWGHVVGFANYTYNTAEGGGFGVTIADHAVNAGVAYLQPFDIAGEIALAGSWAHPMQRLGGLPGWSGRDDQYGVESYWKVLLFPDFWVTPGVQVLFDPSFNPDRDVLALGSIKFRLFF